MLADRLEVSRRTIYRDIDELSAAGVPIYADRGANGGLALLDSFRTELTGLTASETEALLLAGIPLVAADLGLGGAAAGAQAKLLAGLGEKDRADAKRVSERFHLDPLDWYHRAKPAPHLRRVAEAVWKERRLNLFYESWSNTGWLTTDPLGVVLKGGQWYLIGAGQGKIRTYRLGAVHQAQILDEAVSRPDNFDLRRHWIAAVESFEAGLRKSAARVRAAPSCLDRLDRLGAQLAEPLRAATPAADGWREAVIPIESIAHAAELLLGFADEIEVLEPAELRNELAARAARVQKLYASL